MDTLGIRLHVNFFGYAHWFMSIIIPLIKDHSVSVYQDRYATSIVTKYLETVKVKASTNFYKTNFPSDVDNCFYWYTYEALEKWFVDTLGIRLHVNFFGYAHWFMSIIIPLIKDHSVSVYQDRYATSIVTKYLETVKVKASTNFYKTNFPSDMIFTKAGAYNSN